MAVWAFGIEVSGLRLGPNALDFAKPGNVIRHAVPEQEKEWICLRIQHQKNGNIESTRE